MASRRSGLAMMTTAAVTACSVLAACSGSSTPRASETVAGAEAAGPVAGTDGSPSTVVVAFLGDSITAGLGLLENQAYPARMKELFMADGYDVEVVNGGVSGDTTASGLRRYEQLLTGGTKVLVVALGGNDALRGLGVKQTHDNLAAIIDGATARGVAVVVVGMEAPTNLGDDYRTAFHDVFIDLLREYRTSVGFVPFLLEGVAGNSALNQPDGIHPTAEGARIIAASLYPKVREAVDRVSGSR